MIAIAVAHMMTSPPITPPTMAPIGGEECEDVVDKFVDGLLEEPPDPPPGWITADVLAPDLPAPTAADADSTFEETKVAPVAIGDWPGGYCVPVLSPLIPVKMGRSTAWFNPV